MINPSKGFLGDYMAVVIRPSMQYRIERPYQVRLFSRLVGLDDFADFVQMRFGRLREQFSVLLANVLSSPRMLKMTSR